MSRRWKEDDVAPPLDLRLALPAIAVWGGCLVAIWAPGAAWWTAVAGIVAAVGGVVAGRLGHMRSGTIAAFLVSGVAGIVVATAHLAGVAADPLAATAATGGWAVASVTVAGDPAPIASDWGAAPAPSAATADPSPSGSSRTASPGRWRIPAMSRSVEIGGVARRSHVEVTLFATGDAWGSIRIGQVVAVRGTAGVDEFGSLPQTTIRARGDPETVAQPPVWLRWAAVAREDLADSATALSAERGGLLRGLVVGDTRGIDAALTADAKTTGLTHLVAVSGSHLAVIAGIVLLATRRFGPRLSGLAVLVAFTALVILVGPGPSVLRAVVMGVIGVLGAVLGRTRSAVASLAGSVFVLLLLDPTLAVSVGFTLSVQATAGLVLLAPVLERALVRRHVPRGWATLIALPVAAHLATVPVVTAISGRVSLAAIPANMIVAPAVAPALLVGLACLVAGLVSPGAGEWAARIDGPLLGWIAGTAHRLARWPMATIPWPATAVGVVGLAVLITAALLLLRRRTARVVSVAALAGAVVVLVGARMVGVGWPSDGWLVTMCDVGQGDAIVLATGVPGEAVVVDTGPEPTAVDECLDRLRIDTIALLVLTHLHADHIGGLRGAMDGRRVEAVGLGPDRSAPEVFTSLTRDLEARSIPIEPLAVGAERTIGELRLDVLGPAREFHGTESDANNESVVMRATVRGVRILLCGDVERPAQRALLASGQDLAADVLKQPHHGSSKLLPEFVAAVHPRVALVGVGAGNDYGHPATSALDTDRAAGVATILRTDLDGDVSVLGDADGLRTVSRGGSDGSAAR